MGLLDGIEKLITEHGSSAILRERIALARDQYEALEKKIATFQDENATLKSEYQRLELDNDKLKQKIKNLEEQLSSIHEQSLDETEMAILKLLASAHSRITAEQVAGNLGIHVTKAEYFFKRLQEREFINAGYSYLNPTTYGSAHGGNEYLVKNNLV